MIDGVEFDPVEKTATFRGRGLILLQSLILKARFGEPLDPDILFNQWITELALEIDGAIELPEAAQESLDKMRARPGYRALSSEVCREIAKAIVVDRGSVHWWSKSPEQQRDFLRTEAAAPHRLTDDDIQDILDSIEGQVSLARELAAAAHRRPT
jgi:hypothetical protein